jgi:hypothetical protein
MCACNIKTKKNGNWLGLVMDLFGRLLNLSLENNAFPTALMDLFQKNSSRLIRLIVTARPNLSWHYGSVKELSTTSAELIDMNVLLALKYDSLRDTTFLSITYSCSISFFSSIQGPKVPL